MTTQTITTNNNCNNNNKNKKDMPNNQGLFPVESSDEKHISAGAAGGRQELRFTVHTVCCVQKFTVHSVYCTKTVFESSLCTNYCPLCTTTANYCSL